MLIINHFPDQFPTLPILHSLFDRTLGGELLCRYVIRVEMMSVTCFSRMEELIKISKPIIDQHFNCNNTESISYKIELIRRGNNDQMKRDAVIQNITKLITNKIHQVDLKTPETVILIQIIGRLSGISIVDKWTQYKQYNLRICNEFGQQINNKPSKPNKPNKPQNDGIVKVNSP